MMERRGAGHSQGRAFLSDGIETVVCLHRVFHVSLELGRVQTQILGCGHQRVIIELSDFAGCLPPLNMALWNSQYLSWRPAA